MVSIFNVNIRHSGILSDGSTKLTLYLPEMTEEQHAKVISLSTKKVVGLIMMEPEQMNEIKEILEQASAISIDSEHPPIDSSINDASEVKGLPEYYEEEF